MTIEDHAQEWVQQLRQAEPDQIEAVLSALSAEQLRAAVRSLLSSHEEPPLAHTLVDLVITQAAHQMGTRPELVRGRCRNRPVTDARAIAMSVLRAEKMSSTAVGEVFAMTHASVLHAQRRVASTPRLRVAAARVRTFVVQRNYEAVL